MYSLEWLKSLSDQELGEEIRNLDFWDADLCGELCDRAGLADEWAAVTAENSESLIYKAAEKLGVEVL